MTEGPIKLFATRAERYPHPNDIDTTRTVLEKTAEFVPIFGPATVQVIGQFLVPGVERRREEWFRELADDFDRLKETVDGFSVENLAQNEALVSAMIQATRIAIGTHQEKKREHLRSALLNIALGTMPDEVKQQIFLNAIEAFAPAHVQALVLIRGAAQNIPWEKNAIPLHQRTYGSALGVIVPELKGQVSLIGAIFVDLRNRGFSSLSGPDLVFPQGGLITNLGAEFLNFVLRPEGFPR